MMANESLKWTDELHSRQEASDPATASAIIVHHANQEPSRYKDELEKRNLRPYEVRLFITRWLKFEVGCWLRTRFADNHPHETNYRLLRDIVWSVETGRHQSMGSNLTVLLMKLFRSKRSEYCSAVCTVASALSNRAENVTFELNFGDDHRAKHEGRLNFGDGRDVLLNSNTTPVTGQDIVRKRFALLMAIVFRKVKMKRLLIDKDGSNAFRLVYCQSYKSNCPWIADFFRFYWIPIFSSLLQSTLLGYVMAEIVNIMHSDGNNFHWELVFLAILSSIFSIIQVVHFYKNDRELFLGGEYSGWIKYLDLFVNMVLPSLTIPLGFLIIVLQDGFIEAVLNTAALLFVPTIDDELPGFLDMDVDDIVHTYMIRTAMQDAAEILMMDRSQLISRFDETFRQEFIDVFVTNHKEAAGEPDNDVFAPYNLLVIRKKEEMKNRAKSCQIFITVGSFVSSDSLIRKLKWRYSRDPDLRYKGFITNLYLQKMDGTNVILTYDERENEESTEMGFNTNNSAIEDWDGELSGVFIVTRFRRVNTVTRLRVCGTPDNGCECGKPENRLTFDEAKVKFKQALNFYSLWDLDGRAEKLLDSA